MTTIAPQASIHEYDVVIALEGLCATIERQEIEVGYDSPNVGLDSLSVGTVRR